MSYDANEELDELLRVWDEHDWASPGPAGTQLALLLMAAEIRKLRRVLERPPLLVSPGAVDLETLKAQGPGHITRVAPGTWLPPGRCPLCDVAEGELHLKTCPEYEIDTVVNPRNAQVDGEDAV